MVDQKQQSTVVEKVCVRARVCVCVCACACTRMCAHACGVCMCAHRCVFVYVCILYTLVNIVVVVIDDNTLAGQSTASGSRVCCRVGVAQSTRVCTSWQAVVSMKWHNPPGCVVMSTVALC